MNDVYSTSCPVDSKLLVNSQELENFEHLRKEIKDGKLILQIFLVRVSSGMERLVCSSHPLFSCRLADDQP